MRKPGDSMGKVGAKRSWAPYEAPEVWVKSWGNKKEYFAMKYCCMPCSIKSRMRTIALVFMLVCCPKSVQSNPPLPTIPGEQIVKMIPYEAGWLTVFSVLSILWIGYAIKGDFEEDGE